MCHIPTLKSSLAPHEDGGTDSPACPVGGKIEFLDDQNPTVSPTHTREVGSGA